jgi:hypothetical protein
MPVEEYSLQANSFIDALLKISLRFLVPMGVEWLKSADNAEAGSVRPDPYHRAEFTRPVEPAPSLSTHLCGIH